MKLEFGSAFRTRDDAFASPLFQPQKFAAMLAGTETVRSAIRHTELQMLEIRLPCG